MVGCNSQKHVVENNVEKKIIAADNTTNIVTNMKIVEYDTIRYIYKDTIFQPVKKIIYINQKEDSNTNYVENTETEETKVEDKKVTTSIWGYIISFGIGVLIVIVVIVVVKLIKLYIKKSV